jgi:26S proteasome regulatory subunit N9
LDFLLPVVHAVEGPQTQEAFILATMEAVHYRILLGDLDGAQEAITRCTSLLEAADNVKTAVHASFYRVSAELHNVWRFW